MTLRPRIGVSANFMHADPERPLYRGKTLQYVESGMMNAIWAGGGIPVLVPSLSDPASLPAIIDALDGLVLSGGADVSPLSYHETPRQPAWAGDPVRDAYEIALLRCALERRRPVLGLCRGIQLLNVALGGTLWQDIPTDVEGALDHRDWHRYDELGHSVTVRAGCWISEAYDGATELQVNSVHHQALRLVASELSVVARAEDGIIEAVEHIDAERWCVGLQWHPEWLDRDRGWADGQRIFAAFIAEAAARSSDVPALRSAAGG